MPQHIKKKAHETSCAPPPPCSAMLRQPVTLLRDPLVLWFWLGLIITIANAAKDGHLNWHETRHESALLQIRYIDFAGT